jgi:hypothetical protein
VETRPAPTTRRTARLALASVAGAVALGAALAGCGGSSSNGAQPSAPAKDAQPAATVAPTTTTIAPQPAGPNPSESAKMVCAHEAQEDISGVLGVTPTKVTTPTWVDHLYSCTYQYPNGSMTLSVKELSDPTGTTDYYNGLAATLGQRPDNIPLGQGAFITTNGSVVVRKDWKVLLVDASKLPPKFGSLKLSPSDVSGAVAQTILGCWDGS